MWVRVPSVAPGNSMSEEKVKVKMFEIDDTYYGEDCYHCLVSNVTEWEEVTPEEYQTILAWVVKRNNLRSSRTKYHIALEHHSINVKACIEDYKDIMEAEKVAKKKRAEQAKKRKATKEKRDKEKKLKQFEELKTELDKLGITPEDLVTHN